MQEESACLDCGLQPMWGANYRSLSNMTLRFLAFCERWLSCLEVTRYCQEWFLARMITQGCHKQLCKTQLWAPSFQINLLFWLKIIYIFREISFIGIIATTGYLMQVFKSLTEKYLCLFNTPTITSFLEGFLTHLCRISLNVI